MRIIQNTYFNDFSINFTNDKQLLKEAMSKSDILATIMALISFVGLPETSKGEANLNSLIENKGGSMQTATQLAKSVGKNDPKSLTTNDLVKIKEAVPYEDYWQKRDKKYHSDLNDEVVDNSLELMKRVNALLQELGVEQAKVSSGWRPKKLNDELIEQGKPAAKKSRHITGEAIDLVDVGQKISSAVMKDPSILNRHGLWMEDPRSTRTWVHFDLGKTRDPKRKYRVFKPF